MDKVRIVINCREVIASLNWFIYKIYRIKNWIYQIYKYIYIVDKLVTLYIKYIGGYTKYNYIFYNICYHI